MVALFPRTVQVLQLPAVSLLVLFLIVCSNMASSSCHAAESSSSSSASNHKIKSIVVVGGTHGNEYTGVWISKALERKLAREGQPYTSFHLSTLIGNPQAHLRNQRFVDQDLNRRFSHKALMMGSSSSRSGSGTTSDDADHVEVQRALELNRILGPKFQEEGEGLGDATSSTSKTSTSGTTCSNNNKNNNNNNGIIITPKPDLLIDLHTTTTNMQTTLIVAKGDPLTTKAAAYVILKCNNNNNNGGGGGHNHNNSNNNSNNNVNNNVNNNRIHILMHTHDSQHERPHLSSIAPHCFSIEAGPVPTGVLRHDIVEHTQQALDATLEFMERYNLEPDVVDAELQAYFGSSSSSGNGNGNGGGIIDCFVSAPSQRKGEISSKIPWPSDPDNPNFPLWMIHKSIQDEDFSEIRTGDPLFVDLEDNIISYDGSHGSPVTILFVNEGGYYYASSGTGISVAQRRQFRYDTAELLPLVVMKQQEGEEEEEEANDDDDEEEKEKEQ